MNCVLKRCCFSRRTFGSKPKKIDFNFTEFRFQIIDFETSMSDELMGKGLSAFKGQSRPYILNKESESLVSPCGNKRKNLVPDPNLHDMTKERNCALIET